MPDPLSVRLGADHLQQLALRGEHVSAVLRRDIERYYALLETERATLRRTLLPEEVALIAGVLNGTLMDPVTIRHLADELEDAQGVSLPAGMATPAAEVDDELVSRVRRLPLGQLHALADAVERYWRRVGQGEQPDPCRILD